LDFLVAGCSLELSDEILLKHKAVINKLIWLCSFSHPQASQPIALVASELVRPVNALTLGGHPMEQIQPENS
jgi:hypothetical protein